MEAIERLIGKIKKVEEKEYIYPKTPKADDEKGLGTASTFAKQIYTYWQTLAPKLDAVGSSLEAISKEMMNVEKKKFSYEKAESLLKESKNLCGRGEALIDEIKLLEKMFWFEVNSQYNKCTGIRRGFEAVCNVTNPSDCVRIVPLPDKHHSRLH